MPAQSDLPDGHDREHDIPRHLDAIHCAKRPISLAISTPSTVSRASAKNKLLLKISKSGVFCPRSGPDEGRTRRHETLDRQCGGREGIIALCGADECCARGREIAWS
jgi:hypothetical protein